MPGERGAAGIAGPKGDRVSDGCRRCPERPRGSARLTPPPSRPAGRRRREGSRGSPRQGRRPREWAGAAGGAGWPARGGLVLIRVSSVGSDRSHRSPWPRRSQWREGERALGSPSAAPNPGWVGGRCHPSPPQLSCFLLQGESGPPGPSGAAGARGAPVSATQPRSRCWQCHPLLASLSLLLSPPPPPHI